MSASIKIRLFVAVVTATALSLVWAVRPIGGGSPDLWGLFVMTAAAILTGAMVTRLRVGGAGGSVAFIANLASVLAFGPFWGAMVSAISMMADNLRVRRRPIKALFNTAQEVVSVIGAIGVYILLGGETPPAIFLPGAAVTPDALVRTVGAFGVAAVAYFLINSVAVSVVVGLSTGRAVRDVWKANTISLLVYDLIGSTLSFAMAWLFVLVREQPSAVYQLLFLSVIFFAFVARVLYGKLRELDEAYIRLEQNLREQLEMMVRSIEARDPYTSGHSRRVAALSQAIAMDLGLPDSIVSEIETAALLHDVGKIHAEFAPLLSKEGRLTEEEWEIMKTHSAKSAELVGLFSRFHGHILISVRHHHERWDGKGYPDGVEGESIPLGARIIMISDTVDAMTTDRPYRKALPFEKVVAELIKYRGVQFDPALVDVTINSVTVRRLVSDRDFLAEQTNSSLRSSPKSQARPALRSQKSFWGGLRAAATGQDAQSR